MATSVTLNGTTYSIPATGDSSWGDEVSNYLIALSTGVLQKAGGAFTLTADVDFGVTYGLKSTYYKSRGTVSSTGILRLANTETIAWRNAANSADLALTVSASNVLTFNGTAVALGSGATVTASRALVSDASGLVAASAVTSTELGYLSGVTAPTGNGALVLATSPTLVTPVLGVATATSVNKVAFTAPASGATLTLADGKTLTISNTLTFTGTDSSSVAFGTGGTVAYTGSTLAQFSATTSAQLAGVISDETGSGALVFGTQPTITIQDADFLLQDNSDNTKQARFQLSGISTASTRTFTFPDGSTVLTGTDLTQTLSNKTLTSPIITTPTITVLDNALSIQDNGDATKQMQFQVSGVTAGQTRVLTVPDYNGTIATLAGTETFTNKIVSAGELDSCFVDEYIDINEEAAPSAPSSGKVRVYAKTDKKLYTKNSDGTETAVGSGAGEKNYIAGSSTASGWSNVGDLDVATTTTAAELPREYTTASGIKITADSNTQSVADYVYYDFTLDDVDQSKKLKIQWSQKTTGTYNAGDLAVIITSQADRTTALHTPVTTAIPAVNGVFTTSVDVSTTATLSLVIRATTDMTTDGGIVISDVVVGPGTQPQGAVVGDSQSATFTGSWVSNTTYTAVETRVGAWALYDIKVAVTGAPTSASLTLTMPAGRTIDTTALANTAAATGGNILPGSSVMILDSGTQSYAGHAAYLSTTSVGIYYHDDAAGGVAASTAVTQAAPMTFASGDYVQISFRVPIAEWAGSGTVNLAQNDVEYASNTGGEGAAAATTYSNSAYFAYGPAGSQFASVASTTADQTTNYHVRFQTAIQPTDRLDIEVTEDGGTTWSTTPSVVVMGRQLQSTSHYGMMCTPVNSTTVLVSFGNKGRLATGASFADNGSTWAGIAGSATYKWRVRKIRSGAAVGFGQAAATSLGLVKGGTVPGQTSGATIAAGYIGEVLTFTSRAVTTSGSATWTSNASALTTLTAGVWLVCGTASHNATTAANNWRYGIATNGTSDSSGIVVSGSDSTNNASSAADPSFAMPLYYYNGSGTAIYAKAYTEDTTGTVTITGFAVRIA